MVQKAPNESKLIYTIDFLWLFLGRNQYRREGLWFVCLLYDGSTRRLTESGFMWFLWFYGEAGNRTCDPWFTRHSTYPLHHGGFYCSFLVSVDFLWQSFKHTDTLKNAIFFGDVNVAPMRIVIKIISYKTFFYFWSVIIFMFIEYCFFFLFALHTCKFCKISSINFVMVVYTPHPTQKKIKKWRALFETATSLIKLVVISLSGGEYRVVVPHSKKFQLNGTK